MQLSRRSFSTALAAGLGTALVPCLQAQGPTPPKPKKLKIGHTGITWPGGPDKRGIEIAIKDLGSLGYAGLETFGDVLDQYEKEGGLLRHLEAASLPLISGYCTVDLVDPACLPRTSGRDLAHDRADRAVPRHRRAGNRHQRADWRSVRSACRLPGWSG